MLEKICNTRYLSHIIVLTVIFIVLVILMSILLPPAVDWHGAFRPAVLEVLHGRSPYNAEGFIYPPWTAILLLPFAILPEVTGRAVLVIVYLAAIAYTANKFGAKKISITFILVSPPVLHGILNGNVDWLVVLGLTLPPWLGLFLLVIKPQISVAVIIYLFISIWKNEKIKGIVKSFGPVTIAYVLSLFIFGFWPLSFKSTVEFSWNASLWPLSIPVGLTLLTASIRKNDIRFAMAASPCLSPYVLLHSWIGAFLAIVSSPYEIIAAVIGMWIVVLMKLYI